MKIITANRLTDGVVVYLNADREWVRDVRHALQCNDTALEANLSHAHADVTLNLVIGVEAVAVSDEEAATPARLRERIRAFGPTIDYMATGRRPHSVKVAA